MSESIGATIHCDRYGCHESVFSTTIEEARAIAVQYGWTRTDDGRDLCGTCTRMRAAREKLTEPNGG